MVTIRDLVHHIRVLFQTHPKLRFRGLGLRVQPAGPGMNAKSSSPHSYQTPRQDSSHSCVKTLHYTAILEVISGV